MFTAFTTPAWLFALVLPAALLAWAWSRRFVAAAPRVAVPYDHVGRSRGWGWWLALTLAESLPPLLLAVAVLLLAGPRRWQVPDAPRALTNIEFCVDISGSMTAKFGDGDRYDAAMEAVNRFVDHRKGDSFGLTFFGSNYLHWIPLTSDVTAIKCAPPFMKPELAPDWVGGGTMIGKALQGCKKALADRDDGEKMILLISDGDSFDLDSSNEAEMAAELKKAGITVFAVIIGQPSIQDEVVNITRSTGGEAFEAGDPAALSSVFARIDQMKQAKLQKRTPQAVDNFFPYAVTGLVLAGVYGLSLLGLRYNPW